MKIYNIKRKPDNMHKWVSLIFNFPAVMCRCGLSGKFSTDVQVLNGVAWLEFLKSDLSKWVMPKLKLKEQLLDGPE